MKRNTASTVRLCYIGITIAIYYVLSRLTIPIGNLHITLASLPVVVLAILFGPWDAAAAALVGEFFIQAFGQYGLTPTTPVWCLPPVLRAVIVGLGCGLIRKKYAEGTKAWTVRLNMVLIVGAVATTLGNTAVTWLDSVIYGYYTYAYVFGQLVIRLLTGIVTSAVVGLAAQPIVKALRKIYTKRI